MHKSKLEVPYGAKLLQGAFASFERAKRVLQDKEQPQAPKRQYDATKGKTATGKSAIEAAALPTLVEAKLKLPAEVVKKLHSVCEERQGHLANPVSMDEARPVIETGIATLADQDLTPAAKHAVGQCLWRRVKSPSFSQRCAKVLLAAE